MVRQGKTLFPAVEVRFLKVALMSKSSQPVDDSDETVVRTDVGSTTSVTITRGTGTRDQEKFTIKGKGRTAEEALDEFETQLEAIEDEFADRIRNLQPSLEDGDEADAQ